MDKFGRGRLIRLLVVLVGVFILLSVMWVFPFFCCFWGGEYQIIIYFKNTKQIGSNSGQGLDFIDGYTFLERFYSVFDTTNKRVGFATTAQTSSTSNWKKKTTTWGGAKGDRQLVFCHAKRADETNIYVFYCSMRGITDCNDITCVYYDFVSLSTLMCR